MKTAISSFVVGLIFALGLGISGMTQPQKVISFLDIFGNWDPSLALVMTGALIVHFISYKFIAKMKSPLFAEDFQIPNKTEIDKKLVVGAALFGVGWGLAGYCPAPVITVVPSLNSEPAIFVASMLCGMFIFRFVLRAATGS